jgi:hypothetical protein
LSQNEAYKCDLFNFSKKLLTITGLAVWRGNSGDKQTEILAISESVFCGVAN